MIIELERQRAPVVVISHQVIHLYHNLVFSTKHTLLPMPNDLFGIFQAVLRALYAYFADRPLKEIPHIEVIHLQICIKFMILSFEIDFEYMIYLR